MYSICTIKAILDQPLLSLQSGKMASPRTRRVLKEVRTEDENNVSTRLKALIIDHTINGELAKLKQIIWTVNVAHF